MLDTVDLFRRINQACDLFEPEVADQINQMVEILSDEHSTKDEKMLAFNTILDALEPFLTSVEIKLLTM